MTEDERQSILNQERYRAQKKSQEHWHAARFAIVVIAALIALTLWVESDQPEHHPGPSDPSGVYCGDRPC